MKTIPLILVFVILCLAGIESYGQTAKELKARKIRIVTMDGKTIIPAQVLLYDSTLRYTAGEITDTIGFADFLSINY